jgi:transcriptional regulator with XRE-family HTH domain
VSDTPGVSYELWRAIKKRLAEKGMSQRALIAQTRIPATTLDRLKTQTRPPQARIVNVLADALDIDRDEAHRLAGLVPADEQTDVRSAVVASTAYTDQQKAMLLEVIDSLDKANGIIRASAQPPVPPDGLT